ncbi:hypothetical protein C8Q78DRAFT_792948 [Trametes maxima]|nr:hypothetical protein C8Q78DRAFT_792948 [Trametes maxima]
MRAALVSRAMRYPTCYISVCAMLFLRSPVRVVLLFLPDRTVPGAFSRLKESRSGERSGVCGRPSQEPVAGTGHGHHCTRPCRQKPRERRKAGSKCKKVGVGTGCEFRSLGGLRLNFARKLVSDSGVYGYLFPTVHSGDGSSPEDHTHSNGIDSQIYGVALTCCAQIGCRFATSLQDAGTLSMARDTWPIKRRDDSPHICRRTKV